LTNQERPIVERTCSTCGWSPDDRHGPDGPCEGCTEENPLGWTDPRADERPIVEPPLQCQECFDFRDGKCNAEIDNVYDFNDPGDFDYFAEAMDGVCPDYRRGPVDA